MNYLDNTSLSPEATERGLKNFNPDHFWITVLKKIKTKVNRHVYETWFKQTRQITFAGSNLIVEVPSTVFKQLFEEKYSNKILEIAEDLFQKRIEISYRVATLVTDDIGPLFQETVRNVLPESPTPLSAANPENLMSAATLHNRYTFDRFIVGSSNQFAHAASLAVAHNPAKSYNPLYIHGGVGLGKTHLMHAIGNYVRFKNPSLKVLYVQSEQFTNEVIAHIRLDKMQEFRNKYRNVDILLIDDIQFIAGKESTVSEFFHTFNTLYNAQKQIVISSDQPPRSISNLEERIRSRFEWGLIADIQPPGLETKAAILQKKAEELKLDLPNEIALFIAMKVHSNIRELEGSLLHIAARVSLTGAQIDMEVATEALKQYIPASEKNISVENIQKQVSQFYDIKISLLRSKGRTSEVAVPRQVAMFLARELTQQSLAEIGKKFGGRNHTTVIHACRKVEEDILNNPELRRQVTLIKNML